MEGMPVEGTGLPSVGAEIAGKYRVESVLGQGGMGAVFAARNMLTGKRVAIKWLLPEHAGSSTRDRLLREAQIASSIDHPNVVDIYDVGEHEGGLFLVMEYLRGKPLSDVLAEVGRLDPEPLIALLVPAMRGVHAAHQAGVIHRDLKPENIILSEQDGQIVPKVVDFGVSKMIGAAEVPPSSLTRTGALVGTPHYMALEQVDGSNAVDSRTDVYAFGVLLYRSLTGHFPFDGTSLGEVILKIGTKEASPMRMLRPELPAALDTLVLRALSRDRSKRFRDLEEMARGLLPFASAQLGDRVDTSWVPGMAHYRALSSSSSQHSQAGALIAARPTPPIEARARRRRAISAGMVAVVALCGLGAWLSLREVNTAPIAPRAAPVDVRPAASTAVLAVPVEAVQGVEHTVQPADALAPEPKREPALQAGVEASPAFEAALAAEEAAQPPAQAKLEPARATQKSDKLDKADKLEKRALREHAKAAKPAAPKTVTPGVIPGARTNGFSLDEF